MKTGLLITTFERAPLLRNSLERLASLTLPHQLCVVDDGGQDGETQELVEAFRRATGVETQYLYHDNPHPSICSFARNIGLKHMDADMIVTSEPELMFLTDVMAEFTALMNTYSHNVISAGTVYHQGRLAWLRDIMSHGDPSRLDRVIDHDPDPGRMPDWQAAFMRTRGWVAPYTAAYKRDWLLEIGGWDEDFPGNWGWDDIDLLTRLRLAGHQQLIANEVEVLHQWHPASGDQAEQGKANEAHFYSKSFHVNGEDDKTDVIANRGREWGKVQLRTTSG